MKRLFLAADKLTFASAFVTAVPDGVVAVAVNPLKSSISSEYTILQDAVG